MQMIWQHNDRSNLERVISADVAKRGPQLFDMVRQSPQTPLRQIDGEKEVARGDEVAAIAGHSGIPKQKAMGIAALHPSSEPDGGSRDAGRP